MEEELETASRAEAESPDMHVRTIPACVAVAMREYASPQAGVGAWIPLDLGVNCTVDSRPSRGAALILADQAGAVGVYTTFDVQSPMMTLDLRVDWHGQLPLTTRLDARIEDCLRQGDVALVRGRLLADDGQILGSITGAYLIGAYPGGRPGEWQNEPLDQPVSSARCFEDALAMQPHGEGWRIEPNAEMIGARPIPAYHGGFVAGALEQAAWLRSGQREPVNIEIRYLLPTRADRMLTIETRILRSGRQASIIEADAVQGDGVVVATARAIYLAEAQAGQSLYRNVGL